MHADRQNFAMSGAPKGDIRALRGLWRFVRPYRARLVVAFLALGFSSGAVLGLGQAIRYLVDEGLSKGNPQLLNQAFLFFMGVTALLAVATFARFYLFTWVGERIARDIRTTLHGHLLNMDAAFFETARTGDLLARFGTDVTLVQNVLGSSFSVALRNMFLFLGGTAMLIMTSSTLTLYVGGILPVVVIPILFFGRRVRALSRATQGRMADVTARMEETLHAMHTVQALAMEPELRRQFTGLADKQSAVANQRIRMRALLTALVITLVFGAIVGVLWIGGHDVIAGEMSGGRLSSFVFYAVLVAGAVGALSEVATEMQQAAGSMERIAELLATQPTTREPATPTPLPRPAQGKVEFRHVTFHYPSRRDAPSLTDVSFTIQPGETVALVGPSGAGKTTLFQLLQRFYDPQSGDIFFDGINVRDLSFHDLRSPMGLVPQDPIIFSASLYENIACAAPYAKETVILQAAESAGCMEFIDRLPEGMNTHVGERGARLSGGQKQRIAIARAMVRNPALLLLDEATSALDAENEALVNAALERAMEGRTTLIIAHRLATVQRADRIMVMNHGVVEATGTHRELLITSPLYTRLAELQFSESH